MACQPKGASRSFEFGTSKAGSASDGADRTDAARTACCGIAERFVLCRSHAVLSKRIADFMQQDEETSTAQQPAAPAVEQAVRSTRHIAFRIIEVLALSTPPGVSVTHCHRQWCAFTGAHHAAAAYPFHTRCNTRGRWVSRAAHTGDSTRRSSKARSHRHRQGRNISPP